jgi:Histone methylation protein DOT1
MKQNIAMFRKTPPKARRVPHRATYTLRDTTSLPSTRTEASRRLMNETAASTTTESLLLSTPSTRRNLNTSELHVVTPSTPAVSGDGKENTQDSMQSSLTPRRRLIFEKKTLAAFTLPRAPQIEIPENVRLTYKLIRKISGTIGGNGSFGAIYGELTSGSMQKMVNLMKKYTEFGPNSRFIDVGSGIGKPSLHVLQDPGVEFSYGIEMERSRWLLGLTSLHAVLREARGRQEVNTEQSPSSSANAALTTMGFKCMFDHGNIMAAKTFDPFTHVYMFSIG